jgi:hypothetical protein
LRAPRSPLVRRPRSTGERPDQAHVHQTAGKHRRGLESTSAVLSSPAVRGGIRSPG